MIVNNYKIEAGKRASLLINPPVYGFSDFKLEYSQPTGLLHISSLLKKKGANPILIDCLESVKKCDIHSVYKRGAYSLPQYQFGMSFSELEDMLSSIHVIPEEVYITSFATYWYESTQDTVSLIRQLFPTAKVIVGGIYPTLMPEHAERNLGADVIVVGEVEEATMEQADLDHYDSPKYLGIKPSRGCPHNCGYCAQRIINKGRMVFQNPTSVCDEIEHWYHTKSTDQVYFFSENFLVNKKHFTDILTQVVDRGFNVQIAAPKGLEPRLLDKSVLKVMKAAGWKGMRLALETISEPQKKKMERLYNDKSDYERAIRLVTEEGFEKSEIGTFLLYGLPEENIEDVVNTAEYIHSFGGYIIPMAFTPVPQSLMFKKYTSFLQNKSLVELAGNLYPFAEYNGYTFKDYLNLERFFAELNRMNAVDAKCEMGLSQMETRYNGIYSKSEIAFAMAL